MRNIVQTVYFSEILKIICGRCSNSGDAYFINIFRQHIALAMRQKVLHYMKENLYSAKQFCISCFIFL